MQRQQWPAPALEGIGVGIRCRWRDPQRAAGPQAHVVVGGSATLSPRVPPAGPGVAGSAPHHNQLVPDFINPMSLKHHCTHPFVLHFF